MTITSQVDSHVIPLVEGIDKTFIIAYKESTELLEQTLTNEGFSYEILRQQHQPEYKDYSPSYLCLLNHKRAWEIAAQQSKPTLIVEADFVPVVGLGHLPLPFNSHQPDVGVAWLYSCAAQLYSVSKEGYANGFSASTVAYIITPKAAKCLIELQDKIKNNPGPTVYSSWDSTVDNFLRANQFKNYIPFRNYGEHGGLPNLEHYRRGLSKTHRADVLYGKLAFVPMYVANNNNNWLNLFQARLQARLKGIARLLSGKFIRIAVIRGSSVPMRLIGFAVIRQFSRFL